MRIMNIKHLMIILVLMSFMITIGACKKKQSSQKKSSSQTTEQRAQTAEQQDRFEWNFDDIVVGQLPATWKVEGTRQEGPLAAWQVIEDTTLSPGGKVLALTHTNHNKIKTFNLCWTDSVTFRDGEIEVKFKSIKGKIDQGGGIIWRVKDKDNYYIARFNPLEDNFRFYYVLDGKRKRQSGKNLTLPAGMWQTMKIVQKGPYFEGYLNGEKLLEGEDSTFTEAGGVGVWTKADAVTSFDDFSCQFF